MVSPLALFTIVFSAFVPFAVLVLLRFRSSNKLTRAARDELLGAIKALRGDLSVARLLAPPPSGDAAPAGGSPPSPPSPPPAPLARKVVSVTRDERPRPYPGDGGSPVALRPGAQHQGQAGHASRPPCSRTRAR